MRSYQGSAGFGEFDRTATAAHHREPDLALQCGNALTTDDVKALAAGVPA